MKIIKAYLACTLLGALLLGGCASKPFSSPFASTPKVKVVYHVNTDVNTAPVILNNIRSHLSADPTATIVVVTHGPGINFLLLDAKDSQGREFRRAVSDLANLGADFRVCNSTLMSRQISPNRLLPETRIVPLGVAEVARLQTEEGYVYLRP
jgi:intracellular sulfur oxidation DsrE/DsrF family protein